MSTSRSGSRTAPNYGNASSVLRENGGMAQYVIDRVGAGMVGVNIGVPVPREPFPSAVGTNRASGGRHHRQKLHPFWTQLKRQPPSGTRKRGRIGRRSSGFVDLLIDASQ